MGDHALEASRHDLVEEAVEQIGSLITTEETVLVGQSRELQLYLRVGTDAGHDRVDVAAAETAFEVGHRRVEVAELRLRDERDEQHDESDTRPEFHDVS